MRLGAQEPYGWWSRKVMVRGKGVSMAALKATITKCNATLKESVEYLPTQY